MQFPQQAFFSIVCQLVVVLFLCKPAKNKNKMHHSTPIDASMNRTNSNTQKEERDDNVFGWLLLTIHICFCFGAFEE